MNLARFAHSYANLRSVNLAGQKSACEGPADVECRRTRPVPILEALCMAICNARSRPTPVLHTAALAAASSRGHSNAGAVV